MLSVHFYTFSGPYLSNGQAIGSVVHLSVCHGCIVAKWCEIGLGCINH